jgi:hypothetical protein
MDPRLKSIFFNMDRTGGAQERIQVRADVSKFIITVLKEQT